VVEPVVDVKVEPPDVSTVTRAEVVTAEDPPAPAPAPPVPEVAVVVDVPVATVVKVVSVVVAVPLPPDPDPEPAVTEAQKLLPYAMTDEAVTGPQTALEQSRIP
jgi:hypothetical protein